MRVIPLSDGTPVQVSDEDFEELSKYKWYPSGSMRHATGRPKGKKCMYMARYIMQPSEGMVVDHIDRNPHNNQRSNLRICTQGQNQRNRAKQRNNSSGYKGVYWSAAAQKWMVLVGFEGKSLYFGLYASKEEAKEVYDREARRLHGEFALTNS